MRIVENPRKRKTYAERTREDRDKARREVLDALKQKGKTLQREALDAERDYNAACRDVDDKKNSLKLLEKKIRRMLAQRQAMKGQIARKSDALLGKKHRMDGKFNRYNHNEDTIAMKTPKIKEYDLLKEPTRASTAPAEINVSSEVLELV